MRKNAACLNKCRNKMKIIKNMPQIIKEYWNVYSNFIRQSVCLNVSPSSQEQLQNLNICLFILILFFCQKISSSFMTKTNP